MAHDSRSDSRADGSLAGASIAADAAASRHAPVCDRRAIAEMLAARADVAAVRYPGLSSHPGHDVASRQMRAFGTLVSFDLSTRARAESFLRALTIVREATSFGGVLSMAERRARWGGDAISEGFIRFSVGCEATADIVADVEQALDRSR
jgi:cystathionine gamma-lyase